MNIEQDVPNEDLKNAVEPDTNEDSKNPLSTILIGFKVGENKIYRQAQFKNIGRTFINFKWKQKISNDLLKCEHFIYKNENSKINLQIHNIRRDGLTIGVQK
jgi:hypothetical protein